MLKKKNPCLGGTRGEEQKSGDRVSSLYPAATASVNRKCYSCLSSEKFPAHDGKRFSASSPAKVSLKAGAASIGHLQGVNMNTIDFAAVNRTALPLCPGLLESLLPGGSVQGREYQCSNLFGGGGDSLRVNLDSGKWADFAADEKGGDLVSLVAAIKGMNQPEAAKVLSEMAGIAAPASTTAKGQTQGQKPAAIVPDLWGKDAERNAMQEDRPVSFRALQIPWRTEHRADDPRGKKEVRRERQDYGKIEGCRDGPHEGLIKVSL